jgi:hypothetical protein
VFDSDRPLGAYCCAEPTHWAWLVDSLEQLLAGIEPDVDGDGR